MRVSLEQIRQQNQMDKEQFYDLAAELQHVLDVQVQILRTSRYRDNQNHEIGAPERLRA